MCEHLQQLEQELLQSNMKETYRGQAWSHNCREWVYFHCVLDLKALRERLEFDACVQDHEHRGTHDGSEAGFVCSQCHDGIMGVLPKEQHFIPIFK